MRCPTCGTENAMDSRFCGGCGAKFAPPGPRLAPTHRISDDTPYPERPTSSAAPADSPYAPPRAPDSIATTSPKLRRSSGSSSLLVPAGRPFGLIALVLIIDLGLAVAGAVLLMKGLRT